MNTKEVLSPVPEVGQVRIYGGVEVTIYAKEPCHRDAWATCKAGMKDDDGYVHKAEDCCWMYDQTLRGCPLVTPVSTPSPSPTGKVEPKVKDVWRWLDADDYELTTHAADGYYWVGRKLSGSSSVPVGSLGHFHESYFGGNFTFVRHAPGVSGEVGAPTCGYVIGSDGTPCAHPKGHEGRHAAPGTRHWTAPASLPGEGRPRQSMWGYGIDAGPLVAPDGVHPSALGYAKAVKAAWDNRVKTYDELLAALCAEEGVGVPTVEWCPVAGHVTPMTSRRQCVDCYAAQDARVAAIMREVGDTKPVAEPPPWTPSTDPDFWIPGINEHGGDR